MGYTQDITGQICFLVHLGLGVDHTNIHSLLEGLLDADHWGGTLSPPLNPLDKHDLDPVRCGTHEWGLTELFP